MTNSNQQTHDEQVHAAARLAIAEAECVHVFETLPHLATMYDIYVQLCVDRDHIADRALRACYAHLGYVLAPVEQPLVLHDEPMEPHEWLTFTRVQVGLLPTPSAPPPVDPVREEDNDMLMLYTDVITGLEAIKALDYFVSMDDYCGWLEKAEQGFLTTVAKYTDLPVIPRPGRFVSLDRYLADYADDASLRTVVARLREIIARPIGTEDAALQLKCLSETLHDGYGLDSVDGVPVWLTADEEEAKEWLRVR